MQPTLEARPWPGFFYGAVLWCCFVVLFLWCCFCGAVFVVLDGLDGLSVNEIGSAARYTPISH
jgi:hypothetical protein